MVETTAGVGGSGSSIRGRRQWAWGGVWWRGRENRDAGEYIGVIRMNCNVGDTLMSVKIHH